MKARSVRSICLRQRYIWCTWRLYLFVPILWSRSSSVQQPQQQAMEQMSCSLARSVTLAEKTAAKRYMIKLYLQGSCLRSCKVCILYTTRSIRSIYYEYDIETRTGLVCMNLVYTYIITIRILYLSLIHI